MLKSLTAVGEGLALIIDKSLLELLKIDLHTPLEVTTDGKSLIIRPAEPLDDGQIMALAERVMDAHEETLRKLAL